MNSSNINTVGSPGGAFAKKSGGNIFNIVYTTARNKENNVTQNPNNVTNRSGFDEKQIDA
jgi:hypothetical protein